MYFNGSGFSQFCGLHGLIIYQHVKFEPIWIMHVRVVDDLANFSLFFLRGKGYSYSPELDGPDYITFGRHWAIIDSANDMKDFH